MRKKILFLHPSNGLYGGDRVVYNLARGINREKFEPVVFIPFDGPLRHALGEAGVRCEIVPMLFITKKMLSLRHGFQVLVKLWFGQKELHRAIGREDPDLVHVNILTAAGAALIARFFKAPMIWHIHEIIDQPKIASLGAPYLVWLLGQNVVCNSTATADYLLKGCGTLRSKTRVIHNGIDETSYTSKKRVVPEALKDWGENFFVFLLPGRLLPHKGQMLFIDAALQMHQSHPECRFLILGDPPQGRSSHMDALARRVQEANAKHLVRFAPFAENIADYYAHCDVVVNASECIESFGLTLVEAMAMGKVVIAPAHGGPLEIVEDGVSGWLFEPGKLNALINVMKKAIEGKADFARMGEAGKKRQRTHFSHRSFIHEFEKYFDEILSG